MVSAFAEMSHVFFSSNFSFPGLFLCPLLFFVLKRADFATKPEKHFYIFQKSFLEERKKLFFFWVAGKMESGSQDLFATPPKSCSNNTNWAKYTFRLKPVQTQRFKV